VIVARDKVRACVERALLLDPNSDTEAAIASTAQALGLPVEAVRECVEKIEEPV